jgi:predicted GNAT family acetyltransferase
VPEGVRNGVEVRMLDAEDRILPSAVAVQYLAFAEPGTACGRTGLPDLAEEMEARVADGTVDRVRARLRAGATMFAAAVVEGVSAVSAGQHNPVGAVSEIVGVATLPAHRRQGLGLTVTAALVADARARGVRTVFLSAEDHDVMRIYAGLGFERVGTALVADA